VEELLEECGGLNADPSKRMFCILYIWEMADKGHEWGLMTTAADLGIAPRYRCLRPHSQVEWGMVSEFGG
jgi:hypothetical protein